MADGNLQECGTLHPVASHCAGLGPWQMYGDVWEWTSSPFALSRLSCTAGGDRLSTASSCAIRWCCAAVPVRRRATISGQPTATSSTERPLAVLGDQARGRFVNGASVAVYHFWLEQPAGMTAMTIRPTSEALAAGPSLECAGRQPRFLPRLQQPRSRHHGNDMGARRARPVHHPGWPPLTERGGFVELARHHEEPGIAERL